LSLQSGLSGRNLNAMPELPDISAYLAALGPRIFGATLQRIRLQSVFVRRLSTFASGLDDCLIRIGRLLNPDWTIA